MELSDKIEAERIRGIHADQLLSNPLMKEFFLVSKAELFERFQRSKFDEDVERTEIWRKMESVRWLESYLTKAVQTGIMSEKGLKQAESMAIEDY